MLHLGHFTAGTAPAAPGPFFCRHCTCCTLAILLQALRVLHLGHYSAGTSYAAPGPFYCKHCACCAWPFYCMHCACCTWAILLQALRVLHLGHFTAGTAHAAPGPFYCMHCECCTWPGVRFTNGFAKIKMLITSLLKVIKTQCLVLQRDAHAAL